jgi:hypothetical protein
MTGIRNYFTDKVDSEVLVKWTVKLVEILFNVDDVVEIGTKPYY